VSIDARAARIKLLLFDIDGVLTDGTVVIHADGSESKAFGIRDGIAIVWAQRAGLKVGFSRQGRQPRRCIGQRRLASRSCIRR
jgi:3-deoxy-D-manno-octulosonate 8-phosphate phosphatase KdsC-like HAD superfamily phosphatase